MGGKLEKLIVQITTERGIKLFCELKTYSKQEWANLPMILLLIICRCISAGIRFIVLSSSVGHQNKPKTLQL